MKESIDAELHPSTLETAKESGTYRSIADDDIKFAVICWIGVCVHNELIDYDMFYRVCEKIKSRRNRQHAISNQLEDAGLRI